MIGALAVALATPTALADDVHLDAGVTTSVPTDLGVRVAAELPARVRVGVTGGFMPPAYLGLINGVATSAGWYDEPTAQLIETALHNAIVLRLDAGFRPLPDAGWTADAGYMVAFLGGGLAPADAVTGGEDTGDGPDAAALQVSAVLHMVTIQAGHQWVIADRLVVGANVGGAFTLTSSSSAEIDGGGGRFEAANEGLEQATEELLNTTLRKYVHTPTLGVLVGFRFR